LIDGKAAFRRLCEAIEEARESVWATITFMWPSFRMPDGRTALDVLNSAAARGIDVRIIFYRPNEEYPDHWTNAFWGSPEHFGQLDSAYPAISIRWDRPAPGYCQHQKSWLVDAGREGGSAFLGGLNLNPHAMTTPGHEGNPGQIHDLYIEVSGPSVVDVHHNFVQRWNGASERHANGGVWGSGGLADLPWPTRVPTERGRTAVQIQRTITAGRYPDAELSPSAAISADDSGERTVFEQYCAAIDAAHRSIYLEQQYIQVPEIVERLRAALVRGVEVVALVPNRDCVSDEVVALQHFPTFTLVGIAGRGVDGTRHPVWIHAKVMIVDQEWGTVGSCNLHRFSLFGNSEINASFWDPEVASHLLHLLVREHLDSNVSGTDDVELLRTMRALAIRNSKHQDTPSSEWQGHVYVLRS
jgi:phosphatidylserine/phosphatidylglycerophosphate/cardiolipin synthase-like enzyme